MRRTGAQNEGHDTHAAVLEDMGSRVMNMEKESHAGREPSESMQHIQGKGRIGGVAV